MALLALLVACRGSSKGPEGTAVEGTGDAATTSPQAHTEPAPLVVVPALASAAAGPTISREAGPPPSTLRADRPIPQDGAAREERPYALVATFRTTDVPGLTKAPEVSQAGLEILRKKSEARASIELGAARMRVVFQGRGFATPPDAELRARFDGYGFALVLPPGNGYRVVPTGALRALLSERRTDVSPTGPAEITPQGEAGRRFGQRVQKVQAVTRVGRAVFELARVPEAGDGGLLLGRMLLDLLSAAPSTVLSTEGDVPIRAEYTWAGGGGLVFDVIQLARRTEPTALPLPPPGVSFVTDPIAAPPFEQLASKDELASIRTGPVELPLSPKAAEEGLAVVNHTEEPRFLLLDGAVVARVGPHGRGVIEGLHRGRYQATWRTFLGDVPQGIATVTVPGRLDLGASEAPGK
jgi:hypothetical protein